MGPTASGKTAVAVAIARQLPVEIISVDSAQVYRGMDIGTAKPDARTLRDAPHHLIDILDPTERFSAADFCEAARPLMDAITAAGRVPLLVGGTMLYFKALKEGLSDLPEADPAIRLVIDTMAQEVGWPAMHEQLERLDPDTAERLDPNDAQRIQRALEVIYATDRPLSATRAGAQAGRAAVPGASSVAGAVRPQCAPCAHCRTLRGDARARADRRIARAAQPLFP